MTNPPEKLYATPRDTEALGEHYMRHIMAMTAEGLHEKSAIAAELAWRDAEIERLRNLCRHVIQADVTSDAAKAGEIDVGDECYLCWWASDAMRHAAEGNSIAGSLADNPPTKQVTP